MAFALGNVCDVVLHGGQEHFDEAAVDLLRRNTAVTCCRENGIQCRRNDDGSCAEN